MTYEERKSVEQMALQELMLKCPDGKLYSTVAAYVLSKQAEAAKDAFQ